MKVTVSETFVSRNMKKTFCSFAVEVTSLNLNRLTRPKHGKMIF